MPGRSEAFYAAQDFLRAVSLAYKLTDRELISQYRSFALSTFLFPRDIFMSAMAGRLFCVTLPDGRVLYSRRVKEVMSQSLDVLSMVNGAMLYRAPWGWDALVPGSAGYVLTINAQGLPEWLPPLDSSSSVRSGIVTGLDLWGSGQGSGFRTLSDRRFAVDLTGVATSSVTFFFRISSGLRSVSSRALFENVAQSGGDAALLQFTLRVIGRGGAVSSYALPSAVHTVPSQGQTFAVDVSWSGVQVPSGDAAASVTVTRYGAASEDTHNGIVSLYLAFWEYQ